MNPIQVVMLSPDLDVKGGISFVVREYLNGGLAERVDLRFIPTHKDGSHVKKIGVFLVATGRLLALAPTLKHSIVHFHTSQNGSFFRKFTLFCLARAFGAQTVVHIHGSEFEAFMTKNALFRALTRYYFDRADRILVMSSQWLERIHGFTQNSKVSLLFNPIALADVRGSTSTAGVNVLFMGRLGQRKGIYDLLECIQQNCDYFRQQSVRFILAGDGDIDAVRQYASDRNLNDLIEVPGWIASDQKERYLQAADILILPSYNEQMPMSILEAMSRGYPIVATRIAGIPDLVEHGVNGFLFAPGDLAAMTQALQDLCQDPALRAAMGRAGRERVKAKFQNIQIVEQLVAIYQGVQAGSLPK